MNTISYWLYNYNESKKDISNIINYHIKRLNLQDQSSKNSIEVKILKTLDNNIFPIFKKNETEKTVNYPILSCMIFLTDSELPFVITEIHVDNYKYKEFKNQDTLHVIFPKKNTHVVFNGNVCNGFINPNQNPEDINNEKAILINVWDNNRTENTKLTITTEEIENETTPEFIPLNNQIIWTNDFLTYNMYNNLLYMKKYTHEDIKAILELYNKDFPQNWYVIKKSKINLKNLDLCTFKNRHNNNQPNFNNRFLQRFHIKNFLSPNTCDWLIHSATKNDTLWKINDTNLSSYSDDENYICMMENNEMKSFTRSMLEKVCDEINKSYNINIENIENNGKIEITDVLLVKYDKNNTKNNRIKMYSNTHHDITSEIMLSLPDENNNTKEGQLMFDDGLDVILNKGDMIIYSNFHGYSVNKIFSENTVLYKIIIHMKIKND
uniref:Uncharacterized protein n=1 Tax=viral metagenome TaxID=1070528 RepID=A0A6C0HAL0_9ZZZZ